LLLEEDLAELELVFELLLPAELELLFVTELELFVCPSELLLLFTELELLDPLLPPHLGAGLS